MIELKPEPICCNQCGKPVDQSDPLDFSCGLACESCIRKHYCKEYGEFTSMERKFEAVIQEELVYRRRNGKRALREILRYRAKEERKR